MARAFCLMVIAGLGSGAAAQGAQAPMGEVVGQPLSVTTGDVTNTLYFQSDGTVRIVSPGGRSVASTWAMEGKNFCLKNGSVKECWPYRPFETLEAQTLTSSCDAQSTWVAQKTNYSYRLVLGERGR